MSESDYEYDLLVLGSGPAGQKAALAAAKLKKKVAIIEPRFLGGVCTNTGTMPSKTLREAVIQLTNYRLRFVSTAFKYRPKMSDLAKRVEWVISHETEVIEEQLRRNGIEVLPGYGKFKNTNTINIFDDAGKLLREIRTKFSVICSGTTPFLPENVPFDGKSIFYTDNILSIEELPASITIVGGGIIGMEFCSIFSILGIRVNVVEKRSEVLAFVDRDIRTNLISQLDVRNTQFFLNDSVASIRKMEDDHVDIRLDSGRSILSQMALFCTHRIVATDDLGLNKAKVDVDERGMIVVNDFYQTSNKCIYAAGDVVGHPQLASTSFEQGRIAGTHAFQKKIPSMSVHIPVGIYTIPEISFIGPTEEQLSAEHVPYSIGKSFFKESSRGVIMGALDGMLKLIFHQESKKLLAVHIIGENASELVHLGQAVIEFGGTIYYFIDNVFNHPTLAETYKYAALSGLNRMQDV